MYKPFYRAKKKVVGAEGTARRYMRHFYGPNKLEPRMEITVCRVKCVGLYLWGDPVGMVPFSFASPSGWKQASGEVSHGVALYQ